MINHHKCNISRECHRQKLGGHVVIVISHQRVNRVFYSISSATSRHHYRTYARRIKCRYDRSDTPVSIRDHYYTAGVVLEVNHPRCKSMCHHLHVNKSMLMRVCTCSCVMYNVKKQFKVGSHKNVSGMTGSVTCPINVIMNGVSHMSDQRHLKL